MLSWHTSVHSLVQCHHRNHYSTCSALLELKGKDVSVVALDQSHKVCLYL